MLSLMRIFSELGFKWRVLLRYLNEEEMVEEEGLMGEVSSEAPSCDGEGCLIVFDLFFMVRFDCIFEILGNLNRLY